MTSEPDDRTGHMGDDSDSHDDSSYGDLDGATGTGAGRPPGRSQPLTVALVATQSLTRDILAQWLYGLGRNVNVTPLLADGSVCRDLCHAGPYSLIVIECDWLDDPGMSCLDLLDRIARSRPDVPVVVVSDSEDPDVIVQVLERGAHGFIPTTFDPVVATAALRLVLSGGLFAPMHCLLPTLSGVAGPAPRMPGSPETPLPAGPEPADGAAEPAEAFSVDAFRHLGFTVREAEVLILLQRGKPNRQIATTLGISENTVMVHIRHLMRKLGATNRTQAVFHALRLLNGDGNHAPTGADDAPVGPA